MTEALEDPGALLGAGAAYTARLKDALVEFTGCIGQSLAGICSFGLTMGENYVPFDLDEDEDCEDEEAPDCSQAWVRVMNIAPVPGKPIGFDGRDHYLELTIDLEVGVLRCLDIPEGGEAPTTTEVLGQALQSMDDMNDILCAALNCGATDEDPTAGTWDSIEVGTWAPLGPLGGQHGGSWSFTVTI